MKTPTSGGPAEAVYELVLRAGDRERLVWYWYDISGRTTLSAFGAKLLSKRAALFDTYRGEAAIIVSTAIGDHNDDPAARLQQFLDEEQPGIARFTE